jgi:hypothetical protein
MLGLGHSMDPGAIMAPSISEGYFSPVVLSDDDIAGICDIYPWFGYRQTNDASGAAIMIEQSACTLSIPGSSSGGTGATVTGSTADRGNASTTTQPCAPAPVDHGCTVTHAPSPSRNHAGFWFIVAGVFALVWRNVRAALRTHGNDRNPTRGHFRTAND